MGRRDVKTGDAREVLLTVRALLVDDQAVIVEVTRRVLEYRGIDVAAFTSSSDALVAFQHAPEAYDVAVVDRDMPSLDGPGLAKALWAVRPALPVLFVSAMDDAVVLGSGRPGPYRQLAKPYEADDLVQAVLELGSHA